MNSIDNGNTSGSAAAALSPSGPAKSLEDPQVIEAVEEYLAALEAGRKPDRQEFLARYPLLAPALAECLDGLEFVQSAGPQLRAAEMNAAAAAANLDADIQPEMPLGDYRIVREVGRGGMGVVYEAVQLSLGRRVALKVLPFAAALDPRQLQRFKNEAQAAAALHHTNIVPVYGISCERGVHFYAMQYVDGQNLTDAIAGMRAIEARKGGKGPPAVGPLEAATVDQADGRVIPAAGAETAPVASGISTARSTKEAAWFRTVAGLGIQAAEALDHAHQQGVVHRDVKPGNLLVDGRGHLWVADFGLAQVQSDTKLTLTGDLVGTLRYMSPEQALAKRVVIDHRSDVYSLGATLYELLTLEPVFAGSDRQELLRQIAFEEPPPLRRLNRALPAELETIVLKALEKNPAERYATVQEMADDLRRYLDDKAILAQRPTLGRQLARWSRRHKGAVLAAGLVLLALLGGIAATTWQAVRATEAERQAKAALAEARQAGQQTLEALRTLTDEVLERQLARQTRLTEADRAFLRKVLEHYEGFAATKGDGPESRTIRAEGYHRVGTLRRRLGEHPEALSAYERAHALRKQLAADFPTVPNHRQALALTHNNLGILLAEGGKGAEAEAEYRQSLALQKQLAVDFPAVPDYRKELAGSHQNLGNLLADLGKRAEAEAEYHQAIVLSRQLVADFPSVPIYRVFLANHHDDLGNLLRNLGKRAEAEAEHRQALDLRKQLVADFPAEPDYRRNLAANHINLGKSLSQLGKPAEAEAEFRQALTLQKQLAADFPAVPDYRNVLAEIHTELGGQLSQLGKREEAEAEYRQALALQKQLAADSPAVPDYRHHLAGSHHDLGILLKNLGKHVEAEAEYRQALVLSQQLTADFPTVPAYRVFLAKHHQSLGNLLLDLGKRAEAEAEYRQGLTLQKQLATDFPTAPDHRQVLARSYMNLGILLRQLGKPAEAEAEYRQALALQKQLAADFPTAPGYQIDLGGSYCNLGNLVQEDNNRPAEALPWYEQAIEVLAPLVKREPRLVTARQFLRNSHWGRAEVLMKLNRFADADRDWDRALELTDDTRRAKIRLDRAAGLARHEPTKAVAEADAVLQGNQLTLDCYNVAARVYALSSARIQEAALSDQYAARAVALLRQAREKGYFNAPARVEHLKKDADLDSLHGRADYQALLAEIAAAKK
jgi:serine/threonine protein kinase/Flp pilus assembly protein TadD